MKYLGGLLQHWRIGVAAILLIGIVHLTVTLLLAYIYQRGGYWRHVRTLPLNTFVILPQARPRAQVLPYQLPDSRIAICRFDVAKGPLKLMAVLPEPGWSLSLYADDGRGFYAFPANGRQRFTLNVTVLPSGDRFLATIPASRSQTIETSTIVSPTRAGIAVIRAPIHGRTYSTQIEKDLALAQCTQQSF